MLGFLLVPNFSMIAFTSANRTAAAGQPGRGSGTLSVDRAVERRRSGQRVERHRRQRRHVDDRLEPGPGQPPLARQGLRLRRAGRRTLSRRRRLRLAAPGGAAGPPRSVPCAPALMSWRARACWTATSAASTGRACRASPRISRRSTSPPTCSRSTATAGPVRAAPPSLDMMLNLIHEEHGVQVATAVSEQCLVDRMRNPHDRQRLPLRARLGIHNPKLIASIEVMEANLAEPLGQDELANHVGLFAAPAGTAVPQASRPGAGAVLSRAAAGAGTPPALPVGDADRRQWRSACGFVSPSHFSKCYRDMVRQVPARRAGGRGGLSAGRGGGGAMAASPGGQRSVRAHYARDGLIGAIDRAMAAAGIDPQHPTLDDLEGVDEFHLRGAAATRELAALAGLEAGMVVLDLGCGLGGPSRRLAAEVGCRVIGLDLSNDYVAAARGAGGADRPRRPHGLRRRRRGAPAAARRAGGCGLDAACRHERGGESRRSMARSRVSWCRAASWPCGTCWSGPAGRRSCRPPGREIAATSFPASPDALRRLLAEAGLRLAAERDRRQDALDWMTEAGRRRRAEGPAGARP